MRDTLTQDCGIDLEIANSVCREVFEVEVPKYCLENVKDYPEKYGGMYMIAKKIHYKI